MSRSTTIGGLWILLSAIAFMLANILIRHLSQKLPPLEMALFRSAGGLVMLLVAWRAFMHLRELRDPLWHVVRAVVGAVSLMALVHSYATLPIALVTTFMYLRSALVIPLTRVILGERAGLGTWAAVALGITGGVVALWPKLSTIGTPEFNIDVLALPIAAIAGAGSHVCMRRLGMTNSPSVVVAVSAVLISSFVAVPAASVAIVPPAQDLGLLAGMALLSGFAQWATVRGYQLETPSRLAPLSLADVPLALTAGFFLWGEIPTAHAVVGSTLIILSSLYVIRAATPR
ncbi:DMT family transporter [Azospirillum sp. Sh1]|uniref:DMT family transporter n=1 Tax=Azospirillum sp. Sh1 TaxID=2607285 RepID=UPI00165DBE02|nr:DMT family transporter [Azospirillum sp. Sh1]